MHLQAGRFLLLPLCIPNIHGTTGRRTVWTKNIQVIDMPVMAPRLASLDKILLRFLFAIWDRVSFSCTSPYTLQMPNASHQYSMKPAFQWGKPVSRAHRFAVGFSCTFVWVLPDYPCKFQADPVHSQVLLSLLHADWLDKMHGHFTPSYLCKCTEIQHNYLKDIFIIRSLDQLQATVKRQIWWTLVNRCVIESIMARNSRIKQELCPCTDSIGLWVAVVNKDIYSTNSRLWP